MGMADMADITDMNVANCDAEVSQWWATGIIEMKPGYIALRGKPVEQLMGNLSFTEMIIWMVLGREMPPPQRALFDVAMVMSVDHGPQAPSIAISRMAITCGIGLNNALASAVNVLGDNHGGAGEQCAQLFYDIAHDIASGKTTAEAVRQGLQTYRAQQGKIIPGYGHRFHKPTDPRAPKVLQILRDYAKQGHGSLTFVEIAEEVERQINQNNTKAHITLNVDGASAAIFCELGIAPPLCRGLFCLARSVGILSHAWEQMAEGVKNKGPMPKKYLPTYTGAGDEK